jgi:putative restriction endonuclease
MRGFIAVTDHGWYERLSQAPGPKDANFWRPSARAFRLEIGTPFFFKLKAPFRAIAGYGFFAGFTVLPDWLAWDTFGEANGVATLEELRSRLSAIQIGARIPSDPTGRIGCCLIAEARFFARDAWVSAPEDWSPRTQTGEGYDLDHGEGARIWGECRARAEEGTLMNQRLVVREDAPRYGSPALHAPRLGQGIFRIQVLNAYGRACAVTGEHSLPALEAAHIKPYADGGDHAVVNGLVLRSDIHRLFDRGYVTVDTDYRFVVGTRLKSEFENGRSYYGLQGQPIGLPGEEVKRPRQDALAWHRQEVFLG